jgi:anaerobic ribonucleoside-triphosphate reductase activating protein
MKLDSKPRLRLHAFVPVSLANGPGQRAVIWLQGCTLGCPGCFNTDTHSLEGGHWASISEQMERLFDLQDSIEGITISGGEPFQQFGSLLAFLECIRAETHLSVILFTGYTWTEIKRIPDVQRMLTCVDVLLTGRYVASLRLGYGLRGSSNKEIHLVSNRYSLAEIAAVPPAEVIIAEDGDVVLSGVNPLRLEFNQWK